MPSARAGPEAEDQHGVQNDVGDAAAKQRGHRRFHPANGLENLFKRKAKHDDGAKRKDNRAVFNPECGEGGLSRKKPQKTRQDCRADNGKHHAVDKRERHADGCGGVSAVGPVGAEVEGDQRVHADAETDGGRVDKVLHRVDEREGGHRFLTDPGDKEAVNNVVQRVDQHRKHHRQRHREQQRQNRGAVS